MKRHKVRINKRYPKLSRRVKAQQRRLVVRALWTWLNAKGQSDKFSQLYVWYSRRRNWTAGSRYAYLRRNDAYVETRNCGQCAHWQGKLGDKEAECHHETHRVSFAPFWWVCRSSAKPCEYYNRGPK